MEKLILNLPFFPGFYESILSRTLDYAVESQAENEIERESSQEYYPDEYYPDELRLDHSDLWDSVNYGDAYRDIARDYVESFDNWMNAELNTPSGSFEFESMTMPREYNFETDRVFVYASREVMESLAASVDATKLQETIESRHKSRSGFISFYSDSLDDWQEKLADGLDSLDHNELATILCAAIADNVDEDSDWQMTICESIIENNYSYLDSHMDWTGYESKCQQWRAEKLAALIADNPDQAARLIASSDKVAALESLACEELDAATLNEWRCKDETRPYRCPITADLFAREGESA